MAWVTFTKNHGVDDVWFDSSRVVDSHPWDKTQLQQNTAKFATKTTGNKNYWLISEGTKYNTFNVRGTSAHAHWLTMIPNGRCDIQGETVLPAILYSKLTSPVYLATRSKFLKSYPARILADILGSAYIRF